MKFSNPKIPEGINTSPDHPLKEFAWLLGSVSLLIVIVISVLGFMAEFLATRIPFSYEMELAGRFADTNPDPSPTRDYLQEIADRLAAAQDLPGEMKITVHYADPEIANAFATLGGHIVIYRGLVEKMRSENALAMVVSHEIAHIKHRHPVVALGRGVTVGIALAALTGVSANIMADRVIGNAGTLTDIGFSRSQESEADATALAALVAVYGHANGSTDVFKTFMEINHSQPLNPPEFLSTHPNPENRIESIAQQIAGYGWQPTGSLTPIPAAIIDSLSADRFAGQAPGRTADRTPN